ncbi:MAG: SpoIID/LytB domain-containing protein [Deltaproteobacteria bacterium]|nr:SpoIID/LytB domain-containing protein [Deltaproteobacteria bacterium]
MTNRSMINLAGVFILAVMLAGCAGTTTDVRGLEGGRPIKVLVLNGASELTISGRRDTLRIERSGSGISVNGRQTSLPVVYRPSEELINLNNRPYRGALIVDEGKGGLMVVNELPLEAYIAGIINNEVSSKWPRQAVMAQAVIARTYALYMKKRATGAYDIEGTTMGQVYTGTAAEDAAATAAVSATEGLILAYDGKPALTVYHSNAGGMTEDSDAVWSSAYPYLRSVASPYDASAPRYAWDYAVSAAVFKAALDRAGYRLEEPVSVAAQSVTPSGRAKSVIIKDAQGGSVVISGEDLRKLLGYANIKSTIFKAERSSGDFVFTGRGNGHGVGLSQWGAKGMADAGYSYEDILRHYYPGAELVKAD